MTGINLVNGALSTNKLFSYKINYENPTNPALKKFNGNISEIDWWTSPSATSNRYDYSYDGLNRLKKADFKTIGASGTADSRLFNEELIYDANGNITNLKRNGKTSASSTAGTLVDNLNYTYTGNRVTNISDATSNPTGYKGTGQLITYDLNGNMKTFPDKGITQPIAYNFLNLPQSIVQNSNATNYLYRADGTKVSKAFTLNGTTIDTDYLDGFVYTSTYTQQLEAALFEDDLATREAATAGQEEALQLEQKVVVNNPPSVTAAKPSFFPTAEGFYDYDNLKYIYQYKDHLGNVRLSYSKNATTGLIAIEDTNDYYPFGLSFINGGASNFSPSTTFKNYKYNGKELQETGMYDYGARFYMPDIIRWGVIDNKAEKYTTESPYTYALNNPIRFIDPDGNEVYCPSCKTEADWANYRGYWENALEMTGQNMYTGQLNSNIKVTFMEGDMTRPVVNINGQVQDLEDRSRLEVFGEFFTPIINIPEVIITKGTGWFSRNIINPIKSLFSNGEAATETTTSSKASVLSANRQRGADFEQTTKAKLESTGSQVAEQVTVKAADGTKTRLDFVTKNGQGNVNCIECKSSATAQLTPNQKKAFPQIQQTGGTVVGNNGAGIGLPNGTKIPPTPVQVVRP